MDRVSVCLCTYVAIWLWVFVCLYVFACLWVFVCTDVPNIRGTKWPLFREPFSSTHFHSHFHFLYFSGPPPPNCTILKQQRQQRLTTIATTNQPPKSQQPPTQYPNNHPYHKTIMYECRNHTLIYILQQRHSIMVKHALRD
jgi:hypothetical protein